MKILKKADEILAKILRWFVITMCSGIGIILFIRAAIRIISRYVPIPVSLAWTDEVVEWMMAWMIFTGAALLFRYGDHFRVDMLQTKFKDHLWVKILNIFISLLSLAFITALLYYSILLVQGATWFSPLLKVSTQVPYMSMPVNCGLILLYLIRDLVEGFAGLAKHRRTATTNTKSESI